MTEPILVGGRYRLSSSVPGGGMGEVWFGHDIKLDRPVAVKFPRLAGDRDAELTESFVRESRITARLEHPGVPAVFDVGTHDGRPYVVMQQIAGTTVDQLVALEGPVDVGRAASIVAQICAVLAAAHRVGLVHRDLKPSNVMLCRDGTVKVMDFGLAVAFDLQAGVDDGAGTPSYLPPERVTGGRSSPRGDLYAVGCVLYELLTGHRAFHADTEREILTRQVDCYPPPPRRLRVEIPAAVDRLCLQLLAKDPSDRPFDAAMVTRALLPFVAGDSALHTDQDPIRLYAVAVAGPTTLTAADVPVDLDERVAVLRAEAAERMNNSDNAGAVALLEEGVDDLTQTVDEDHLELLDLRVDLAGALVASGEFERAADLFRRLAADLARVRPTDPGQAFLCRQQEATCLTLVGEPTAARDRLVRLLADETAVLADCDARPYRVRRQIALLEVAMGRRADGERRLRDLLDDLERVPEAAASVSPDVRRDLKNIYAGAEGQG